MTGERSWRTVSYVFDVLREPRPLGIPNSKGCLSFAQQIQSTGQTPNSDLVTAFAPSAIASNGFVSVQKSLLVDPSNEAEKGLVSGRIFAIGDIADTGSSSHFIGVNVLGSIRLTKLGFLVQEHKKPRDLLCNILRCSLAMSSGSFQARIRSK